MSIRGKHNDGCTFVSVEPRDAEIYSRFNMVITDHPL